MDKQVILAMTAPVHSVTGAMNLATLHKIALTRFLLQKHHTTKTGLMPGHDTPTPQGTDHNPPTIDTDMKDISTDHNHTTIPNMTEAAAVTKGTHCAPHPASTVAPATLWPMHVPIATCAMTHPTGIVTPYLKHTTFPTDATHATVPQTTASLAPTTLTALHGNHSQ